MNSNDIAKALCKKRNIPTTLFFDKFETMTQAERLGVVDVCRQCPVMQKCRRDAEKMGVAYGVWGGALFKRGKIVQDYVSKTS